MSFLRRLRLGKMSTAARASRGGRQAAHRLASMTTKNVCEITRLGAWRALADAHALRRLERARALVYFATTRADEHER